MSSNDDFREIAKRRFEKYPLESMLFVRIAEKFMSMYTELFPKPGQQVYKEIKFFVGKQPGWTKYVLDADDEGKIFIGAVASSITETILSILEKYDKGIEIKARESAKQYIKEVNPLQYYNLKRCTKCKYDNDFMQKFCGQCGEKLQEQ